MNGIKHNKSKKKMIKLKSPMKILPPRDGRSQELDEEERIIIWFGWIKWGIFINLSIFNYDVCT